MGVMLPYALKFYSSCASKTPTIIICRGSGGNIGHQIYISLHYTTYTGQTMNIIPHRRDPEVQDIYHTSSLL